MSLHNAQQARLRPKLVVATSNPGKLRELRALLGDVCEVRSASELGVTMPEETGSTFAQNAVLKATAATRQTGWPAIADDSGLEVEALGGAPGIYSARYAGQDATDARNRAKLLRVMQHVPEGRRCARFVSAVAVAFGPDDVVVFEGTCTGVIAHAEKGHGGFGYDPIFQLPDGRTMAELPEEEKNAISHRGRAMAQAVPLLRQRLAKQAEVYQPSTATEENP